MADFNNMMDELKNVQDYTPEFDPRDVAANKAMGVFAYLGILVLIPLLGAKNSPYARFHANQGLSLAICEIVISMVLRVLGRIPYLGWIFSIIGSLVGIACLVLAIMGIVNGANGRAKELPIVGKLHILQ
ncbi:MAG: hypothetical protein IIY46_09410 [Lachnospiraceae bacterium]|nr:hypothetical protein [Lachnospiraceae bacterium]